MYTKSIMGTLFQKSMYARNVQVYFFVAIFFLFAPVAFAESISVYKVSLELSPESELSVKEEITYTFTGSKHGIYRCLPKLHHEQPSSFVWERYVDIALVQVALDGGEVPYEVQDTRSDFCIRIGDPNNTITGEHTYTIAYTVGGALSYSPYAGTELYWNATGNDWDVPIQQAAVTMTGEDGLLLREQACYRGVLGEAGSCGEISYSGTQSVFTSKNLGPHEGVTVAQALDQTKIATDIRKRMKLGFMLLLGVPLVLIVGSFLLYRSYTKHKTGRPIIPQYEPYPGVKPMYMGALFDGKLDPRDISAGIVYLAERGYVKIRKTDRKVFFFFDVDDYELTITKATDEKTLIAAEGYFETRLMSILFSKPTYMQEDGTYSWKEGSVVSLSELKENYAVKEAVALKMHKLKKDVEEDLTKRGFFQPLFAVDASTFPKEL